MREAKRSSGTSPTNGPTVVAKPLLHTLGCSAYIHPTSCRRRDKASLIGPRLGATRVRRRGLGWTCTLPQAERGDPAVRFTQPFRIEQVSSVVEAEHQFVAARTALSGPGLTRHTSYRVELGPVAPYNRRFAARAPSPAKDCLGENARQRRDRWSERSRRQGRECDESRPDLRGNSAGVAPRNLQQLGQRPQTDRPRSRRRTRPSSRLERNRRPIAAVCRSETSSRRRRARRG